MIELQDMARRWDKAAREHRLRFINAPEPQRTIAYAYAQGLERAATELRESRAYAK